MVTTPKHHDPETFSRCIGPWLARRIPDAREVDVTSVRVPGTGNSSETVFFDVTWSDGARRHHDRLVARIQQADSRLIPDPDVLLQYRMMEAVAAHGAPPVPALRWAEPDAAVLGAPFFVMVHVDGRVASERPTYHRKGWVVDLAPRERERLCRHALRALVQVAELDWRGGFEFLDDRRGPSPLRRYLARVRDWYAWATQGTPIALLEAGLDHLDARVPDEESCGVVWGDARLGNLIIADDLTVVAVIDWEMAALGPREVDLGWWLFFEEFLTDGFAVPPLDGTPTRADVISEYQSMTGHPVHDIEYYEILAAVRMAIMVLAGTNAHIRSGRFRADTTVATNHPVMQILARHLGLHAPELAPEYARRIKTERRS
jgi:aminoglycoside phosphotransferase (APT) family kinase protein